MADINLQNICGQHQVLFEGYYKEVDPSGKGVISAKTASNFLRRSRLSNAELGKIWELADRGAKGVLDKQGFFIALKLVGLVQNGQPPTMDRVLMEGPVPSFTRRAESVAGSPTSGPMFGLAGRQLEEWLIKPDEKTKYDGIFDSLAPENGKLSGDKVKPVLLNSGLPTNVLGKIWEISDIDKDGFLDRDEMAVALHIVYRALENEPIPNSIPFNLIPPSKRRGSLSRKPSLAGGVPVLPPTAGFGGGIRSRASSVTSVDSLGLGVDYAVIPGVSPQIQDRSRSLTSTPTPLSVKPPSAWIVDKSRFEGMFIEIDKDFDGLVSGNDAKGIFMGSGLAQNYLAHIWNLCDIKHNGMLNLEQFALAMYLIDQKKNFNIEPPPTLTPDLLPPSFRPSPAGMTDISTSTHDQSTDSWKIQPLTTEQASGNKDINAVQSEIEVLLREKRQYESNIIQLEANLTIKNSEIKNLEVELSTLQSSVSQLDRQNIEARKRLDELESQRLGLEQNLNELKQRISTEQAEVVAMKEGISQSQQSMQAQEAELNKKRTELQTLRDSEAKLEVHVQMSKSILVQTEQKSDWVENQIKQVLEQIQQMRDHNAVLTKRLDGLEALTGSGNGAASLDADPSLLRNDDLVLTLPDVVKNLNNQFTPTSSHQFPSSVGAPMRNQFSGGAQGGIDDPFRETAQPDPFASTADPFAEQDPFTESTGASGFDDPFKSNDPFAGNALPAEDAFGASSFGQSFGSAGGASAPTLPPKNSQVAKKPPPRPAPPKSRPITPKNPSSGGPTTPSTEDPFSTGSNSAVETDPFGGHVASSGSGGFANFADFSQFS